MEIIEPIGTVNLFHRLSDEEINRFKERFHKVFLKTGEYVFKEGDVGDTLYIVEKGVVTLKRAIMVNVEKTIFTANEGTVFGEFSFMDAAERSASALTEQDAELLALKRPEFDIYTAAYPVDSIKIYNNLLMLLTERLRRTNDAYRDAIRWNIELTGTKQLNFQNLISAEVDIRVELVSDRTYEGRVIQLEKSDAGHEVVLLDSDGKLVMIPYHAIASVFPIA